MGKQWKQWLILFLVSTKLLQIMTIAMKLRHLLIGRKLMTNLDSILKSRNITLPKSYGFSSGYVWMQELDYKEG